MKSQPLIPPRDWEALSAYLDGELDPKQRLKLGIRLKEDADLRTALQELRRTRTVLRSQPRLRAPRNFTLTPQMAGVRAKVRPAPVGFGALRLASVLATIFFVIVVAGDLLARSAKPSIVAQSPGVAAPWAGGRGGGGGGGPDVQMKEALAVNDATETEEAAASAAETPAPPAEVETMAATPTAMSTLTPEATPEAALQDTGGSTSEQPTENREAVIWPVLRVLQVLLALLAVGAGLGAWYLRRSARF
jgi:hypothetical protein